MKPDVWDVIRVGIIAAIVLMLVTCVVLPL